MDDPEEWPQGSGLAVDTWSLSKVARHQPPRSGCDFAMASPGFIAFGDGSKDWHPSFRTKIAGKSHPKDGKKWGVDGLTHPQWGWIQKKSLASPLVNLRSQEAFSDATH